MLGAIFAPFAALLAFRPEAAASVGKPLLLGFSVVAGGLSSLLCTLPVKIRQPGSPRRLLPGLAFGLAGVTSSSITMEIAWLLGHGHAGGGVDILNFAALLGFWNSFVLLYFEHTRSRLKMLTAKTQLRSLETRIQPHFFFNTLNTISALIPTQPDTAQQLISRLANLYRKSLPEGEGNMTTLAAELELTREYLEIEKARFGERLQYTLPDCSRPGDGGTLCIPCLTLQHLAENAVRHGIAHLPEGGTVRIELTQTDSSFELLIANPVEDARDIVLGTLVREGHSLQLLADRMRLLYRGQARFQLELDEEFCVRITIPTRHKFL